jgi:hypothetical protein
MVRTFVLCSGCLALGTLLMVGCSGQKELSKPQPYPARGKVTWKGEPVRFAIITFEPTGEGGAEASGRTDEDGAFVLNTMSNDEPDGAVPGQYRVVLENYDPVRGGPLPQGAQPTVFPPGFNSTATVEVKDEENDLDIEIPE